MVNKYWMQWAQHILKALNLKPTPNRIQFLYSWMAGENTKARNNPLATTWDMSKVDPGQRNFNSNGGYPVKEYSTQAIGVQATINTLLGGYYPEILRYLHNNISIGNASAALVANFKTWGTGSLPVTIWRSWPASFKKMLVPAVGGTILLATAITIFVFRKQIFKN